MESFRNYMDHGFWTTNDMKCTETSSSVPTILALGEYYELNLGKSCLANRKIGQVKQAQIQLGILLSQ